MSNSNITKKAIQEAFRELLEQKSLEKITVGDISMQCGINRNTFYYHYHNIQELLEEMSLENVERIVSQYPAINSLEECFDAVADFAGSNRRIMRHVFNSSFGGQYSSSLWRVSELVVKCYLDTVFPDVRVSEYDKQLAVKFFTCSCFGLIVDWINSGMRDDHREEIHRIISCSKGVAEIVLSNLDAGPA